MTNENSLGSRFSSLSLSLSLSASVSHTPRPLFFSFFFPVFTSRPTDCPECCCVFAARRTSRTNLNIYGELHESAAAGSSPNKLTSTSRPQNRRATFLSISHRIDTNLYAVFLLLYNIIQVQSFSRIYSMHTQYTYTDMTSTQYDIRKTSACDTYLSYTLSSQAFLRVIEGYSH